MALRVSTGLPGQRLEQWTRMQITSPDGSRGRRDISSMVLKSRRARCAPALWPECPPWATPRLRGSRGRTLRRPGGRGPLATPEVAAPSPFAVATFDLH